MLSIAYGGGAAKSGVFRSLNDPSFHLSSHLIRAGPRSLDAAGLWQDAGGWMSLLWISIRLPA